MQCHNTEINNLILVLNFAKHDRCNTIQAQGNSKCLAGAEKEDRYLQNKIVRKLPVLRRTK